MVLTDPQTGREVFFYRAPLVKLGSKLRCGNAWYVNPAEHVKYFADLYRLKVVS